MGLPKRLTEMQKRFAEYLVFNEGRTTGADAAIAAGYSEKRARVEASELQNPRLSPLVVQYIGALREEKLKKYEVTYDKHVAELGKIREEALKKGAFSAATNAEKNRGMAAGLYIDRKIIKTGKLEEMSEEQLEAKMKKILEDYAPILNAKQVEGEALEVNEASQSSSHKQEESSSDPQKLESHPHPDHKKQTT
jgi:phage terminase small subunit|tara:strand:+ start:1051 stop:1632 length:582 start_codon:yes stop_codon:yes gene_type:complete